MNRFFLLIICVIALNSCSTFTTLFVGLSLKQHTIQKEKILKTSKKIGLQDINIGIADSNFFKLGFLDSVIYGAKKVENKAKILHYLRQPLNCMFFDKSNNLIAAYTICDAEYKRFKLTWEDYLSKDSVVRNIPLYHNVTFEKLFKGIEVVQYAPIKNESPNVILLWSKTGGRQLKYFFSEFTVYFKNKNINLYVVNCDVAMNALY